MPQGRLLTRAMELGLGRGEAMGVSSAIGAVIRMFVPRLYLKLYSVQPSLPFALLAAMAATQELLEPSRPGQHRWGSLYT